MGREEEILGEPIDIRQAAKLIGCSLWQVRQKLLPRGLPHVRFSRNGKITFYRDQVIHWILEQQKKGAARL